jgi:hypothetical protein
LVAALGAVAIAVGSRAESPPGEGERSQSVEPSPTPTVFVAIPTPTPWQPPPPPPPLLPGRPDADWPGFGPIDATPAHVRTGDGDCLNLRYLPGMGQNQPRECAPEGTLLWFWGEAVEADGETWRYALGMGWVAERYTVPAPDAQRGFGPFRRAIVVATADWAWSQLAEVSERGPERWSEWLPFNAGWGSVRPSAVSPSGRYVAFARQESEPSNGVVLDRETGEQILLEKVIPLMWGPGDRLTVRGMGACDTCGGAYGWTEPPFAEVRPFPAALAWNLTWLADGSGMVSWSKELGLQLFGTDGSERTLPLPMGENEWPGELVVSPSGRYLMAVPYAGPIRIVDVESGAVRLLDRPLPPFIGGRCGGSPGQMAAWIDDETVAWHESQLGRGQNGIVVANLRTGARKVYPFLTVIEMRAAGQGLLTFSVQDHLGQKEPVVTPTTSWLLDPNAGMAWPATSGMFAHWR